MLDIISKILDFSESNELRFIDTYDPRTKTWEELDSGQTLSVHSYTVVRNKVYFLNYNIPGMGVFDPEKNSWSWVSVPRADFRFKLGQWNNKDADMWRATPIILSGYHATSVLINC
ncbi:BnaC08g20230D [Brassica napus]|uniref:BnaC08g20230D protein n=1 Tax=Brassica napus TaxID=3708 RepID=A0A078IQS2_BRANA|nr:BnaC08g20230D [Brassica napus]